MKKHIFFVGAAILSMMTFTPHAISQELNGCWKNIDNPSDRVCFSDTQMNYNTILAKIENKQREKNEIVITYSLENTINTAKIQFIEDKKIHLTLPQAKEIFIKEAN